MSIKDCVEVIRWYQYQLHVKLMRALMHSDIEEILDDEYPSDADGSAKVALIGMDRSIAAWSRLLEHFRPISYALKTKKTFIYIILDQKIYRGFPVL